MSYINVPLVATVDRWYFIVENFNHILLQYIPGGFPMVWGPQVALVLGVVVVVHDGHGGHVFAVDKLGIIITIVRHFSIIVANSSSPEKYKCKSSSF